MVITIYNENNWLTCYRWCCLRYGQMSKTAWLYLGQGEFKFMLDSDAILFKLKWI